MACCWWYEHNMHYLSNDHCRRSSSMQMQWQWSTSRFPAKMRRVSRQKSMFMWWTGTASDPGRGWCKYLTEFLQHRRFEAESYCRLSKALLLAGFRFWYRRLIKYYWPTEVTTRRQNIPLEISHQASPHIMSAQASTQSEIRQLINARGLSKATHHILFRLHNCRGIIVFQRLLPPPPASTSRASWLR